MPDSIQIIEVVFLAMLAGFVALRLVNVLGRRTGQEKSPTDPYSPPEQAQMPVNPAPVESSAALNRAVAIPTEAEPATHSALQAIAESDPSFDPGQFVNGAREAYGMILNAFWKGDMAAVKPFIADEVLEQFERALAVRTQEHIVLESRLISLDRVTIVEASLEGAMAEITVRYDAQVESQSHKDDGTPVTPAQTVQSHDIWTFSRHTRSVDPNWLLVATDAEA